MLARTSAVPRGAGHPGPANAWLYVLLPRSSTVEEATRLGAEVPERRRVPGGLAALGGVAGGLGQRRRGPVIDLAHTASSLTG
jgi:hypothetical protein